ncbi:MAG: histidine phosphatase family protein [Enterocloster bolteae]
MSQFIWYGMERLFNTTGQVQGWADSPLTEEGEYQADAAGKGMKDIVFTTAFSGDLGRQRATAKHILAQNQGDIPELQEVIGLREEFYGGFEGKTGRGIVASDIRSQRGFL